MPPFSYQSRGGDTISQGGLTSATTHVNGDGYSNENRSRQSGPENQPQNHAAFSNINSHISISDRERTPTNEIQENKKSN